MLKNIMQSTICLLSLFCFSGICPAQDNAEELLDQYGNKIEYMEDTQEATHGVYDVQGNLVQETRDGKIVNYEVKPEDEQEDPAK